MTYVLLGSSLALIAYGFFMIAGSVLVAPFLRLAARVPDPLRRARWLVALRLVPAGLGILISSGLVLPAFVWLEPRRTAENVSAVMILLAGAPALLIGLGLFRGAHSLWATNRLVRRLGRGSIPVETPLSPLTGVPTFAVSEAFPLVSLVGWFRPRLFVSRTVLSHCGEDELFAVVAHEAGHLSRGDHWTRLILRACPDLLSLTRLGASIEAIWAASAEQVADDHAARFRPTGSVDLASALVKVARLATTTDPKRLPSTALYRGGGVAARVKRLLERPTPPLEPVRPWPLALLGISTLLLVPAAAALGLLDRVHALSESIVLFLQ
jgi:Zn-dependent protease with chaperone function